MDAAIDTLDLSRSFASGPALDGLTIEVQPGEVLALLGPNGAGKTTTVRLLNGVLTPDRGSARVLGFDVATEGDAVRRHTGVLTENAGLDDRLTTRENLIFSARVRGFSPDASTRLVNDLLERFGLAERADDLTQGFSTGQRKRVALARALLHDPEVLFLDEPTSGLDPVATREVRELIAGLRGRGVTVFLTTHRLEEAERLCDRIAILNTTLRIIGRPDELRRELFSPSVAVTLAAPLDGFGDVVAAIPGATGWRPDGDATYVITAGDPVAVAPELARALVARGADLIRLAEVNHSLEDVYLELVNEDVEAAR